MNIAILSNNNHDGSICDRRNWSLSCSGYMPVPVSVSWSWSWSDSGYSSLSMSSYMLGCISWSESGES